MSIEVAHDRELRGLWVATVDNIDFPSAPGLTTAAQQAELERLVQVAQEAHLNTLFFQVRPAADALYRSDLEPWSRYLTGVEGGDPGFDPLASLVDAARARGIGVHAWLNPYRAAIRSDLAHHPTHVSRSHPEDVRRYGDLLWIDPGSTAARARLVAVVRDLVDRYDIDGIHLDDYFYPYPQKGRPFPDDITFAAKGGKLDRAAWRRSNVDSMVAELQATVVATADHVAFTVSPFGIYRPGVPEGVSGFDPVESLHADPLVWVRASTVDILAPQLYWPTTSTKRPFGKLVTWWGSVANQHTTVVSGIYLSQLGKSADWDGAELQRQLALSRAADGIEGQIWFSAKPLLEDRLAIRALFSERLYPTPVLPPPLSRLAGRATSPPEVRVEGNIVRVLTHARAHTLYRLDEGRPALHRVLPSRPPPTQLPPGTWALAAVGAHGVESEGVIVDIASP